MTTNATTSTTIMRAAGVCEGCGYVNAVEAAVTRMRCGGCGEQVRLTYVRAKHNARQPCDDRCQYAYGPWCSCSCGGTNHRVGYIRADLVPVWVRDRDRRRHEAKQAKAQAKARAKRVSRQAKADTRRAELLARWPTLATLDEDDGRMLGRFLSDMRLAYMRGDMTDRQAAAAVGALEEHQRRQAEEVAREQRARDLAARGEHVRAGRTTFTCRIVSVKDRPHRFRYGQREWNMLVETTQGWRLFGPLPAALMPARGSYDWDGQLRGRVVTMGAHIRPAEGDDPLFGYFRRPEVVDAHAQAPALSHVQACPPAVPAPAPVPAGAGTGGPGRVRSRYPWKKLIMG